MYQFLPPKFKVGDKVKCIDIRGNADLSIGAVYTVVEMLPSDGYIGEYLVVSGSGKYNLHGSFACRFQLVPSKPFVKSEWM